MDKVLKNTSSLIQARGRGFCRGCLGTNLFTGLNLGNLPLANEMLPSPNLEIERFPLHLRICSDCGLGQVSDVVTPDRIFKDYRYLSSISSTFLKHASNYVQSLITEGMFTPGDWVLEIASNDGYLLRNFLKHGIKAIGVEPAANVAEISRSIGVETVSEFFTSALAISIFQKHGYPKLIIANNVMAHVPDLMDFLTGLALLSGPDTQISIENPSLANVLIDMQFDTVYHEHYSYLSATAVRNLSRSHELELTKVEEISVHGGSKRYWVSRSQNFNRIEESVGNAIKAENRLGLSEETKWAAYSTKVSKILQDFEHWLRKANEDGAKIYGYGAAAKASTLLNSIGVNQNLIRGIADASTEKQGRYLPGLQIPIISPSQLFREEPTDVVIFPWNIKHEIIDYLSLNLPSTTRFWCAVPFMHKVM